MPKADIPRPAKTTLFDHLVRVGKKLRIDIEAQCSGSFQVDHELKLGQLLDRQVRRIITLENTAGSDTNQAVVAGNGLVKLADVRFGS